MILDEDDRVARLATALRTTEGEALAVVVRFLGYVRRTTIDGRLVGVAPSAIARAVRREEKDGEKILAALGTARWIIRRRSKNGEGVVEVPLGDYQTFLHPALSERDRARRRRNRETLEEEATDGQNTEGDGQDPDSTTSTEEADAVMSGTRTGHVPDTSGIRTGRVLSKLRAHGVLEPEPLGSESSSREEEGEGDSGRGRTREGARAKKAKITPEERAARAALIVRFEERYRALGRGEFLWGRRRDERWGMCATILRLCGTPETALAVVDLYFDLKYGPKPDSYYVGTTCALGTIVGHLNSLRDRAAQITAKPKRDPAGPWCRAGVETVA